MKLNEKARVHVWNMKKAPTRHVKENSTLGAGAGLRRAFQRTLRYKLAQCLPGKDFVNLLYISKGGVDVEEDLGLNVVRNCPPFRVTIAYLQLLKSRSKIFEVAKLSLKSSNLDFKKPGLSSRSFRSCSAKEIPTFSETSSTPVQ